MKKSNPVQLKLDFEGNTCDLPKDNVSKNKLSENVDYSFNKRLTKREKKSEEHIYREIIKLANHI